MKIRPAQSTDAAAIARVHVESWRTTYAGIIPDSYLAALSVERREDFWRSILATPSAERCNYVAVNEAGEIAGFAGGGPERGNDPVYKGELYAIYLLQQYQGRGAGKGLVRAVVDQLLAEGFQTMLIWVLSNNPARGFYEALGGRLLEGREKEIVIAEKRLVEVAYGWEDIGALFKR